MNKLCNIEVPASRAKPLTLFGISDALRSLEWGAMVGKVYRCAIIILVMR